MLRWLVAQVWLCSRASTVLQVPGCEFALLNHASFLHACRLSSDIFPWCTEYELEQLKDYDAIADELAFAGKLARAYDQRLTFHPSHFVKLAAETDELLKKSIKELEVHSQVRAGQCCWRFAVGLCVNCVCAFFSVC